MTEREKWEKVLKSLKVYKFSETERALVAMAEQILEQWNEEIEELKLEMKERSTYWDDVSGV